MRKTILFSAAIICTVFVLVFSIAIWSLAVTKWLHFRNPVPGDFHSVDGRRMHIYCTGSGSPTILIEAGLGSDWLGWQGVQPQLARSTRVCTYDRSGLGWSEPRGGPRDAETIVRELHTLLNKAGVQRPLVLIGHSAGALYAREYAREFPAEISGVVLVDAASPKQFDELPSFRASYEADKRDAMPDLRREELRVWSGWERVTGHCRARVPKDVRFMAGQYNAQQCRPEYLGGDIGEMMDVETAAKEASRLKTFGKIPLLVLTKDTALRKAGMKPEAIAGLEVWEREQEELKSLSPLSWRVVARGSGHAIYHDRPDVVVKEVSRLIIYLRGGPTPQFGSTTSQ
ncbi:MAG: alpha/beta fold hydrolase [Acidobacteriaceae bacterium]|nr:alpha/beta fold hydrolase [Acidobacteriaceae bacterium]